MNKWAPAGTLWLLEQLHVGFVGQTVPFPCVAGDAGADHVFPRSLAATLPGHHMVEVKFLSVEAASAILAGVVVALVDVLPREFYLFARQAVEGTKDNDRGDSDLEANRVDQV